MRYIFILAAIVIPVWLVTVAGVSAYVVIGAIAALVAGYWLTTLVHELGHVVVGVHEGLPLRWVAVGPFMFDVPSGRLRRSPYGNSLGGCAVFHLGALNDRQFSGAFCRTSAGGPIASLLLAVVCLGLDVVVPGLPFVVATALKGLGGFSLLMGIINAIPLQIGPFRSDGRTYQILLRGGEAADSLVRAIRLSEIAQSQERPAEWPAMIVTRLKETMIRLDAPSPARLGEWLTSAELLYAHYVDRGRLDEAREVLRRVAAVPREQSLVKRQRYDSIDLQTALHLALWDGDVATAERIVAAIPKQSFIRGSTLWIGTDAAIMLARGDARGALKRANEAQQKLARFADLLGVIALEQRWWTSVVARAEGEIAGVAPLEETAISWTVGDPASPVEWFAPVPVTDVPEPVAGWPETTQPETARWLGRGRAVAEPVGHQADPVPFPVSAIIGARPGATVRRPVVVVPQESVSIALLKAVGASTALAVAMILSVIAFTVIWFPFISKEEDVPIAMIAGLSFGFVIQLGIAIWIWRQAGWVWGLASSLFLILVFPLYVYNQNRGMVRWPAGKPVRKFRTALTAGSLILTSAFLIGFVAGFAYYRHVTAPELESTRSTQMR